MLSVLLLGICPQYKMCKKKMSSKTVNEEKHVPSSFLLNAVRKYITFAQLSVFSLHITPNITDICHAQVR